MIIKTVLDKVFNPLKIVDIML